MQATAINLLTRDGGIRATFTPGLNVEQYAELAKAIKHDGDTADELGALLKNLGRTWGCVVVIDPC